MQKAAKLSLFAGVILVVFPPLVGLAPTVLITIRAFQQLGQSGVSDPNTLAGQVSNALIATMLGLVLSVVGSFIVVASALALIILNKRRRSSIPVVASAPNGLA